MKKLLKRFAAAAMGTALMLGAFPVAVSADVPLDWTFVATFGEAYNDYGEMHNRSARYEVIENGFRLIPGQDSGLIGDGQIQIAFNYIQLPRDANFRIYGTVRVEQTSGNAPQMQYAGFMIMDTLVSATFVGINPADGTNLWQPLAQGPALVFAGIQPDGLQSDFLPVGFNTAHIFAHRMHDASRQPPIRPNQAYRIELPRVPGEPITEEIHIELIRIGTTYVSIVNGIAYRYDNLDITWGDHI